jgi:hypothetical protein
LLLVILLVVGEFFIPERKKVPRSNAND